MAQAAGEACRAGGQMSSTVLSSAMADGDSWALGSNAAKLQCGRLDRGTRRTGTSGELPTGACETDEYRM